MMNVWSEVGWMSKVTFIPEVARMSHAQSVTHSQSTIFVDGKLEKQQTRLAFFNIIEVKFSKPNTIIMEWSCWKI